MRCKVLKTIQVNGDVHVPGRHVEFKDDDALALAEKGLIELDPLPPTKEELAAAEAERKAAEEAKAKAEADAKAKAAK